MKKISIALLTVIFIPTVLFAYVSPGKPTGFVNDFADVIPAQEQQVIESKLKSLQDSTSAQVAVVTVTSLGGDTIENYATKLFEEWGIGDEKLDRGLLILVAPNEREARIEVGYGLEGYVTDLQSGNIIRTVMIPSFKDGDYPAGISGAVDAISGIISHSPDAEQYAQDPEDDSSGENVFPFLFLGFVLLNVLARLLGRSKSWWFGGVLGAGIGSIIGLIWGFFFAGIIAVIILTILGLIFDWIVSQKGPGSGGPGSPWIFFGPGMGGRGGGSGFGGFGGGMSGGGGASGRW